MAITRSKQDTKKSEQVILNDSFDEDFNILAVELVGHDTDANVLRRVKVNSAGAVQLDTTALDSRYVNVTGDTMTGALTISSGGLTVDGVAVFNEAGADVDFRVEGDTNANLLFADASTDRIGINTASPTNKFSIVAGSTTGLTGAISATNTFTNPVGGIYIDNAITTAVTLSSNQTGTADHYALSLTAQTAADANTYNASSQIRALAMIAQHQGTSVYPNVKGGFFDVRNTSSGGVTNLIGNQIILRNSGSGTVTSAFGLYLFAPTNTGGGAYTNSYGIYVQNPTVATTNYAILTDGGKIVFNEGGNDSDVRMEGDTETALFSLDASTDRVGIGVAAPATRFEVRQDQNGATVSRVTNSIALGNTSASAQFLAASQDSSGFFGAFPSDHTTTRWRDRLVFGANSTAAGFALEAGNSGQDMRLFIGSTTESARLTLVGLSIGTAADPTAILHLKAGTATASTAPLKFTSGTSLTTAEAGAIEFTTDDLFFTITTGAARKAFILDDGARLTSGRVPFATTNGRLTDDADLTFATDTLTATKLVGTTSVKAGTAAGFISSDGSTGATGTFLSGDIVPKAITVKDGIITSII